LRQLRASVLRDLAWLLNSGSLEVTDDFSDYPLVASSVINYGVRDFTGHLASSLDADTVAREVEEAIRRFEPRIMPKTLKVRAEVSTDLANRNALVFEIAGELWGEPMPETLRVKTLLDLETGEFSINRDGAD
jgi:type VI secretion system protein ImpF